VESISDIGTCKKTHIGTLIQGAGLDVINVPLHQVFLQSELLSGPVIVGVRPTLPVEDISLILGQVVKFNQIHKSLVTCAGFDLC